VCFVDVARKSLRQQSLQLELDGGDRIGVEQLAEVFAPQQLGQQVAVKCQRLGAPLGQRLVAFIHELRDIREKKRRGEWRGALGVDRHDANLPRPDRAQQRGKGRHVEVIAHHLAPRLGQDREVGILPRDLQQAGAAHALLPQRRALARPAPGQQQRARGVLAEPRSEQCRGRQLR